MKKLNQCLTEVKTLNIKLLAEGTESEAECHDCMVAMYVCMPWLYGLLHTVLA